MPYNAKKIAGRKVKVLVTAEKDMSARALDEGAIAEYVEHVNDSVVAREIDGKFATTTNGAIVKLSNGEVLPDDEPLFLFRARDNKALKVLTYYRELCALDEDSDWQVKKMSSIIDEFLEFKKHYPGRMKQPGITKGA